MKPGFALSNRNQAQEHTIEESIISCCKEIQNSTKGEQVGVDHLVG
jgi:hypothetical protein